MQRQAAAFGRLPDEALHLIYAHSKYAMSLTQFGRHTKVTAIADAGRGLRNPRWNIPRPESQGRSSVDRGSICGVAANLHYWQTKR